MGIPKEKQMHPAVTEEGVAAPQRVGHKPRAWLLCTFFTSNSNTQVGTPERSKGEPFGDRRTGGAAQVQPEAALGQARLRGCSWVLENPKLMRTERRS